MRLRVLLLLLAAVFVGVHADEDAATLERMGYTKEWLRANGYSSYEEYRNHQRQREVQLRQQAFEQQQSQRALEAAEAQRDAAIAFDQAMTSNQYFSLWPLFVGTRPGFHFRHRFLMTPPMGGVVLPGHAPFPHNTGNGHVNKRR